MMKNRGGERDGEVGAEEQTWSLCSVSHILFPLPVQQPWFRPQLSPSERPQWPPTRYPAPSTPLTPQPFIYPSFGGIPLNHKSVVPWTPLKDFIVFYTMLWLLIWAWRVLHLLVQPTFACLPSIHLLPFYLSLNHCSLFITFPQSHIWWPCLLLWRC